MADEQNKQPETKAMSQQIEPEPDFRDQVSCLECRSYKQELLFISFFKARNETELTCRCQECGFMQNHLINGKPSIKTEELDKKPVSYTG